MCLKEREADRDVHCVFKYATPTSNTLTSSGDQDFHTRESVTGLSCFVEMGLEWRSREDNLTSTSLLSSPSLLHRKQEAPRCSSKAEVRNSIAVSGEAAELQLPTNDNLWLDRLFA